MGAKSTIRYFDITVDSQNIAEDIYPVLSVIRPLWDKTHIRSEQFTKGYVNKMTCFYHQNDEEKQDAIVVRVHGNIPDMGIVSRDKEFLAQQASHAIGCFPSIYASFNNGMMYQYAPGRGLTYRDLTDPKIIRKLTHKLYQLHHVDLDKVELFTRTGERTSFDRTVSAFNRVKGFIDRIPECSKDSEKDVKFQEFRKELTTKFLNQEYDFVEEIIDSADLPISLSHGDFHMNNMVYNDTTGSIFFLDYEVTSMALEYRDMSRLFVQKPYLDRMGIFNASEQPAFTEEHRQMWLRGYLDAKYESLGKKTDEALEGELELLDVAHRIVQIATFFESITSALAFVDFPIDIDLLKALPLSRQLYFSQKADLPGLRDRCVELKSQLNL